MHPASVLQHLVRACIGHSFKRSPLGTFHDNSRTLSYSVVTKFGAYEETRTLNFWVEAKHVTIKHHTRFKS